LSGQYHRNFIFLDGEIDMMNEHDVVSLLKDIENLGIIVWIGGGWGVDALIGSQTRPHNDVDIYTEKKNANSFIKILISKGYLEVKMEYTTESHTVWQNSSGLVVDLHLIEFREEDTEALYFEGEAYPLFVLRGKGTIGGIAVRCFTAEAQLLFHQGYEHNENDIHDVLLLCKTFELSIPEEYRNVSSKTLHIIRK
jgi:lincosamide nucleotidyltransferase A/C/D/E